MSDDNQLTLLDVRNEFVKRHSDYLTEKYQVPESECHRGLLFSCGPNGHTYPEEYLHKCPVHCLPTFEYEEDDDSDGELNVSVEYVQLHIQYRRTQVFYKNQQQAASTIDRLVNTFPLVSKSILWSALDLAHGCSFNEAAYFVKYRYFELIELRNQTRYPQCWRPVMAMRNHPLFLFARQIYLRDPCKTQRYIDEIVKEKACGYDVFWGASIDTKFLNWLFISGQFEASLRGFPTPSAVQPQIVRHGVDDYERSSTDTCLRYTINLEHGLPTYQVWSPGMSSFIIGWPSQMVERIDNTALPMDDEAVEDYRERIRKTERCPDELDPIYKCILHDFFSDHFTDKGAFRGEIPFVTPNVLKCPGIKPTYIDLLDQRATQSSFLDDIPSASASCASLFQQAMRPALTFLAGSEIGPVQINMIKASLDAAARIFYQETGGELRFIGVPHRVGVGAFETVTSVDSMTGNGPFGRTDTVRSKIRALMSAPEPLLDQDHKAICVAWKKVYSMESRHLSGGTKKGKARQAPKADNSQGQKKPKVRKNRQPKSGGEMPDLRKKKVIPPKAQVGAQEQNAPKQRPQTRDPLYCSFFGRDLDQLLEAAPENTFFKHYRESDNIVQSVTIRNNKGCSSRMHHNVNPVVVNSMTEGHCAVRALGSLAYYDPSEPDYHFSAFEAIVDAHRDVGRKYSSNPLRKTCPLDAILSDDVVDVCKLLSVSVCTFPEFASVIDNITPEALIENRKCEYEAPILPCIIMDGNHVYVATEHKKSYKPYSYRELCKAMEAVASREEGSPRIEVGAETKKRNLHRRRVAETEQLREALERAEKKAQKTKQMAKTSRFSREIQKVIDRAILDDEAGLLPHYKAANQDQWYIAYGRWMFQSKFADPVPPIECRQSLYVAASFFPHKNPHFYKTYPLDEPKETVRKPNYKSADGSLKSPKELISSFNHLDDIKTITSKALSTSSVRSANTLNTVTQRHREAMVEFTKSAGSGIKSGHMAGMLCCSTNQSPT